MQALANPKSDFLLNYPDNSSCSLKQISRECRVCNDLSLKSYSGDACSNDCEYLMMTKRISEQHDLSGSNWRRWDPHIHSPGTTFEDRFGGDKSWDDYIARLESTSPAIEALGVTDYFRLDGYKKVIAKKTAGALKNVKFIFPNIELRYGIGSPKGSPINFHLLVSPEDKEHIENIERFLESLTFKAGPDNDTFRCTDDHIRRLGRMHKSDPNLDNIAAFREGANQFKVSPDEFLKEWADNSWVQQNVLVAVPASSRDGTASLQGNDALVETRRKLERISHIIFSSRKADRRFWLGQGSETLEKIKTIYDGPKPCIHGCDAHSLEKVGEPSLDRYTWIKGDPCFETLRQICIEPESRAFVGPAPPTGSLASQTISSVSVQGAPWFRNSLIDLNSGLVGIIGARGSGKTALADMIAAGGHSLSRHLTKTSFVQRASHPNDLLGEASVTLNWAEGSTSTETLRDIGAGSECDPGRIQYLSQQFVEQLCSADGATEALIEEIERVIFNAHPQSERMTAETFREFLEIRASAGCQRRRQHEHAIAQAGAKVKAQRDLKDKAASAKITRGNLHVQNEKDKKALTELVSKEAAQHSADFEKVSAAASNLRSRIESVRRRLTALQTLKETVSAFIKFGAENELDDLKRSNEATELDDASWQAFKKAYVGNPLVEIENAKSTIEKNLAQQEGDPLKVAEERDRLLATLDEGSNPSFLSNGAGNLSNVTLAELQAEEARLRSLMALDEDKAKQHKRLSDKISENVTKVVNLDRVIEESEAADQEIKRLLKDRNKSYQGVFEGIIDEERQLRDLYSPIGKRLEGATGALGKLTFSINRIVDIKRWANVGEMLIDARAAGDFKGKGSLAKVAEQLLLPAWQSGDAQQAAEAMIAFRSDYDELFRSAAKVDKEDKRAYAEWATKVSTWLYDTRHISVSYGLQYEGIEIETLSPGTRGIVLLLLYLAINVDDDRPLLVDQPEENLDPKSIYEELVDLFRGAKQRRQIIIVTHNANLVVNTDADQVIIADCGALKSGSLPDISYQSGSLENEDIRRQVCQILEGGEEAFRDRAKRLRIQ